MNGLSHKQAKRYMQADLDGLLSDTERLDLETHLAGCEACRAESESFSTLTSRLQSEFHERWDLRQDGPSHNVLLNVRSQTRRISMSNKVKFGLRALGGIAVLLVLGFGLNFVVSRLQDQSTPANGTTSPNDNMPVKLPNAGDRLLAFTKVEDGNADIYTIHAGGSGLTNLTNNSSRDANPYWSPDGKYIAFESDRSGTSQIYLMDADGSNVVQLTDDKIDRILPLNVDGTTNPWSPDGSKLLFLQDAGQVTWALYSMDISGENKVSLATGRISASSVSWSPDGRYIGYVLNDSMDVTVSPPDNIFVVDADGKNPREIKKLIPQDEYIYTYRWSLDGASITFITSKKNHSIGDSVYEFDPETNILLQKATFTSRVLDWQDGVSLIMPAETPDTAFVWQRSDGTSNTLDWGAECWQLNFRRSTSGNFAISAYCPGNKSALYWANSDGSTIKKVFAPPAADTITGVGDISWSPDDQYIAFAFQTPEKTTMYILDTQAALENFSTMPQKIFIGEGEQYLVPSWQPGTVEETVTTDEQSTQTSTNDGLVAFTSAVEDGNLNIYTVHPDGSELTNLTKNPAHDMNPFWSPDGKRIAFTSDRAGYMQIFTMNADGSDVVQVTDNEADHEFQSFLGDTFNPWSPDGSTLAFIEKTSDGNQLLSVVNVDERSTLPLASQPGYYSSISWSPDGNHIAYILLEPDEDLASVLRIYVTDKNGSNITNVTSLLPEDETIYSSNYTWTQEGNIRFLASRSAWENDNGKFAVYEATVDGKTLTEITKTSTPLEDWWEGTAFVRGFTGETLTWLRADGTYSEFKPYENCQMGSEQQYGGLSRRSSTGYLLYAAGCPNGDLWLYWANPDGTDIRQLLASPINTVGGGLNDINWSLDGGHITLTVSSSGITYLYILDVREALKSPLFPPEPIAIGGGDINYNVSWQPMP